MKHIKKFIGLGLVLLALFLMITTGKTVQAAATDLFFSEYAEGSGYNKAVEIYNGTGATVDLSTYSLELYSNGSTTTSRIMTLSGTLADGDVYVLVHKTASSVLIAAADVVEDPTNVINFNGDDAVVLKNGGVVVDAIGQIGVDPGSQWGSGDASTKDNTIRRMATVCAGESDASNAYDPTTEWDGYANNTHDGFGTHTANCDSTLPSTPLIVIDEIMQNPSSVYDSNGEWFELYNAGSTTVDVDGWTVQDNDYDSFVINNGGPLLIPTGGYLVLGNNAASGTNGGVTVDYQYSGMYLSNSADELVLLDGDLVEIDRVEYDNGATFPDPTGASMSLDDSMSDNNAGANWCNSTTPYGLGDLGTPGDTNSCIAPIVVVKIHEVQGNGSASPLYGQTVAIEGIVVGDFQDGIGANGDLNGFFVQEEDADADADATTSEGVFVYNGSNPIVDVANGDLVRVVGMVSEFYELTQITSFTDIIVLSSGNAMPTAATITLPVGSTGDWEYSEGMLINIPHTLYATGNYNWGRYGEVDLSNDRLYNPTNVAAPGAPADVINDLNDRSRIQLEDGRTAQNPTPVPYLGVDNTLRAGDTLPSLTGVLHYGYGFYEVHPTGPINFTRANVRSATPVNVGGTVKVASFNVLNYFTTLDDGSCPYSAGCRGADNAFEFARQRVKIISAITAMDADIIGLMEMENHPTDAALEDLVNGLNTATAPGTYDYLATGAIGTDAIKVAYIYKVGTVTPVGPYAILDSSVDPTFIDSKNRPALAQTFQENLTGAEFTAVVNHLKSKGSNCDSLGDPDMYDGQGNCNQTRTSAAIAIANWLATDPTSSGDPDFMIMGDLNAYAMEDPITALEAAGYTNLIKSLLGDHAYSYVFFGEAGYLDHALANNGLASQVTGIAEWHINSDEPSALNYNDYNQAILYQPDAYAASDHDPVIIGLDLNAPPACGNAVASVESLWPANHKMVTVAVEGVTDSDGDAITIVIDSIMQDEAVLGNGSGNTSPDGQGVGLATAEIRAEREGGGNGRFYHISFTANDGNNNTCTGLVSVSVPVNQGVNGAAVDDGALYDSTQ